VRARGQPGFGHPRTGGQRFRAPARSVPASGNGGFQRPDVREICTAVCRCRVPDGRAAIDVTRLCVNDVCAKIAGLAAVVLIQPLQLFFGRSNSPVQYSTFWRGVLSLKFGQAECQVAPLSQHCCSHCE
jgi:hypothetical protein